jgi:hypothetical protein
VLQRRLIWPALLSTRTQGRAFLWKARLFLHRKLGKRLAAAATATRLLPFLRRRYTKVGCALACALERIDQSAGPRAREDAGMHDAGNECEGERAARARMPEGVRSGAVDAVVVGHDAGREGGALHEDAVGAAAQGCAHRSQRIGVNERATRECAGGRLE